MCCIQPGNKRLPTARTQGHLNLGRAEQTRSAKCKRGAVRHNPEQSVYIMSLQFGRREGADCVGSGTVWRVQSRVWEG